MTENNDIQNKPNGGSAGMAQEVLNPDRLAVAIDLSNTAIRGMVCSFDENGKFEKVIVCDEVENDQEITKPIRTGKIVNIKNVSDNLGRLKIALQNRLEKILFPAEQYKDSQRPQVKINAAYVALGCPYASDVVETSRNMNGEEITEEMAAELRKKAEALCANQETMVLSVTPQEYVVDDEEEANPVGLRCDTVFRGKFLISYANKSDIETIKNIVSVRQKLWIKGGLKPTPEILSDSILSEEDKRKGVVLVNIGAETTSLAMYKDGVKRKVATRPYGGKVLTEDVRSMKKNMKFQEAEMLKWHYACVIPSQVRPVMVKIPGLAGKISTVELAKVSEACYENMFGDVVNELYSSPYWNSVCGMMLTGGGARMRGLVDFLEHGFGDKAVRHYFLPEAVYNKSREAYDAVRQSNTAHEGVCPDDFLLCYSRLQDKLESCVETVKPTSEQVQKPAKKAPVKNSKKRGTGKMISDIFSKIIDFTPTDHYPKE